MSAVMGLGPLDENVTTEGAMESSQVSPYSIVAIGFLEQHKVLANFVQIMTKNMTQQPNHHCLDIHIRTQLT